jgi:hypothetical protein
MRNPGHPDEGFFNPTNKVDTVSIKGIKLKQGDMVRVGPKRGPIRSTAKSRANGWAVPNPKAGKSRTSAVTGAFESPELAMAKAIIPRSRR